MIKKKDLFSAEDFPALCPFLKIKTLTKLVLENGRRKDSSSPPGRIYIYILSLLIKIQEEDKNSNSRNACRLALLMRCGSMESANVQRTEQQKNGTTGWEDEVSDTDRLFSRLHGPRGGGTGPEFDGIGFIIIIIRNTHRSNRDGRAPSIISSNPIESKRSRLDTIRSRNHIPTRIRQYNSTPNTPIVSGEILDAVCSVKQHRNEKGEKCAVALFRCRRDANEGHARCLRIEGFIGVGREKTIMCVRKGGGGEHLHAFQLLCRLPYHTSPHHLELSDQIHSLVLSS
eukprot:gene12364-8491_t